MSDWVGYICMAGIACLVILFVWIFIIALCIVGDMWGVV